MRPGRPTMSDAAPLPARTRTYRVVDLFAGAGGLSTGFVSASPEHFEIVAACEQVGGTS